MKTGNHNEKVGEVGKRIHTAFHRFSNGVILDLIRSAKFGTGLVLYRHGKVRIGRQIEYKGRTWRPSKHPIIERMRLPGSIARYADPDLDSAVNSADSILDEIFRFLLTFIDFSFDTEAMAAARYGLSTWFTRRLSMIPILSIAGPTGSGKSKLARCLHCICRRPLSFGVVNPATLRSLPMRFRPTLILDEVSLNDEMVRLLRTGTHCDGCTYRNRRPIDLFCPKIVVTQEPLADAALINRAVEIRLVPTSRDMPDLTPAAIESFESEILPRIFRFFLENYNNVRAPQLDALSLSPHKRDVARALAAPSESFDQGEVVYLLQPQDESASVQRFFTRESAVLFAMQKGWLQKVPFLLSGGIASLANKKLDSEGERWRLSPREVGPILRRLGFKTEKIHNLGIGIWMTQEVMKLINNLGSHYGIFMELPPVNTPGTKEADAAGKEPRKKPPHKAAVSDLSADRKAWKRQ